MTTATTDEAARDRDASRAPRRLRLAVTLLAGLVCLGALYLLAVRGEALLLDLSAAAGMLCL